MDFVQSMMPCFRLVLDLWSIWVYVPLRKLISAWARGLVTGAAHSQAPSARSLLEMCLRHSALFFCHF